MLMHGTIPQTTDFFVVVNSSSDMSFILPNGPVLLVNNQNYNLVSVIIFRPPRNMKGGHYYTITKEGRLDDAKITLDPSIMQNLISKNVDIYEGSSNKAILYFFVKDTTQAGQAEAAPRPASSFSPAASLSSAAAAASQRQAASAPQRQAALPGAPSLSSAGFQPQRQAASATTTSVARPAASSSYSASAAASQRQAARPAAVAATASLRPPVRLPRGWKPLDGGNYYEHEPSGQRLYEHPTKDINEAIHKRIIELQNGGSGKRIAILVNGGSFNPIHNGHLEMYIVARNYLIQNRRFDDVLVIYVVSPFISLLHKNNMLQQHETDTIRPVYARTDRETKLISVGYIDRKTDRRPIHSYSYNPNPELFDEFVWNDKQQREKYHRIELCREAFASIDNIRDSRPARDGNHLSKNMFVWPIEESNAFSIPDYTTLNELGGAVRFYGLSGADYFEDGYFLYGINGYSIMVGRYASTADANTELAARVKQGLFSNYKYLGENTDTSLKGIYIPSKSTISSSGIRPGILQLRNFVKSRITNKYNIDKNADAIIDNFKDICNRYQLLQNVPNSILFRLLTFGEPPQDIWGGVYYGLAKYGYMQFRKWLFQKKIRVQPDTTGDLTQWPYDVVDDVASLYRSSTHLHPHPLQSGVSTPIEFLQMSSAHALYIVGNQKTTLLNFANADIVGGGVIKGSTAQEETVDMMAPQLYMSLKRFNNLSNRNGERVYNLWGHNRWHSKFYYSSNPILFETTDEFTFSNIFRQNPFYGYVISAAAYEWNKGSSYNQNFGDWKSIDDGDEEKLKDFDNKMIKIIKNIIAVAAFIQKSDVLILGAWGCGAFAPRWGKMDYIRHIAKLFCHCLYSTITVNGTPTRLKDLFQKVIFPIPDCTTYDIFKKAFEQQQLEEYMRHEQVSQSHGGGAVSSVPEYIETNNGSSGRTKIGSVNNRKDLSKKIFTRRKIRNMVNPKKKFTIKKKLK